MVVKLGLEGELVSIGRAAKVLGVSINTIRNWERRGYLQSYRLVPHAHRRYDLGDLSALKRAGLRAWRPLRSGGRQ